MSTWYKYRVYCETDAKFEYVISETEPTTCPTNTSHTITPSKTCVIDERDPNSLKIAEETIPTGGNFGTSQIKPIALPNSVVTVHKTWPFPISALVITFTNDETHKGNKIDMAVGKNTIIGAITNSVTPAEVWVSQNYTIGQSVLFTDAIGIRPYTCIVDTTSNQAPSNKTYWKLGYEIDVSPTAVSNSTMVGYYIRLDDSTNNDDLGRIISIDQNNRKIYLEFSPTHSFSAATPTYIRQSIYILKDYELDVPWEHDIGQSKIGGAYVPADTQITVDYTNNTNATSQLIGRVEFLY